MRYNKIVLIIFTIVCFANSFSQNCDYKISGSIVDLKTHLPLEFVNIYITENEKGASTNADGYFEFSNLCLHQFHLVLSHIGCDAQQIFIDLKQDTVLHIHMNHSDHLLNDIVIHGKSTIATTQNVQSINEQNINDNSSENLTKMLENIAGVSSLKNGNGIAKPVINGLFGNRITILNNGISQSGQQWGNDHSPEIDPLVANKITVIKGVSALEYIGSNLGGIVIVAPKKIEKEPHLHGRVNYFFESNGNSNGLNLQLQQHKKDFGFKINGTLKKSGDRKTASYFLNNTGNTEANFALQLEKSFSERWKGNLYFSTFNTELGVLRGSHIGNLTDLESAFSRAIPFYTEENFSYEIEAPKQKVNHHLLKLNSKYFLDETNSLDFTFASQINNRKEFDIRRGGFAKLPALSLQQQTYFLEAKHKVELVNDIKLKSGLQYNFTYNNNNPETGVLPLIPNYISNETGAFFVGSKKIEKSLLEIGFRYDNIFQKVATLTNSFPYKALNFTNKFNNYSAAFGWFYTFNPNFNFTYNIGFANRNPAINELYSNGLHQGVSGIEEGNIDLKSENSIKTNLSLVANFREKISFESLVYIQNIKNYIFLNPQDEFRLTIRGAFPVFKYEQTNALIYGLDFSSRFQILENLQAKLVYSAIKGNDLSNKIPLINIPANNISANVAYHFDKNFKVGKHFLENFEIELNNDYVFKQNNLLPEQDFIESPDAYNLAGLKLSSDLQLKKTRLRFIASSSNIFNTSYRDYLNRQRYFADDLGRNNTFTISLKF